MTTTALFALAWLLSGLLVARCMPRTDWGTGMGFDLLNRKIMALEAKAGNGQISSETREALVRTLICHAHVIVEMEALLCAAPEAAVADAHLIAAADEAPELQVIVAQGSLAQWRALLSERDFVELGIADRGLVWRAGFVVHLAYGVSECAEAVAA